MSFSKLSETRFKEYFAAVGEIGKLGPGQGYLRAAYSDEETAAIYYVQQQAARLGGRCALDALGNFSARWDGASGQYVEVASHLDTVPNGGNYDGAAGVLAGLVAIETLLEEKPRLSHGLCLRVWRAEESSTFNSVYTGSRAAFGLLEPDKLLNRFRGVSLEEAMLSQGADPELVRRGLATISTEETDAIAAHLELHIEQGNLLEKSQTNVGIIKSIRGAIRLKVELHGSFDHSGATPMGVEFRKDVNLALGYILVALNKACTDFSADGSDLVMTVGVINSNKEINEAVPALYQNAVPKVSGYGYFFLDIRSDRAANLESFNAKATETILKVSGEFNVTARVSVASKAEPVEELSAEVASILRGAALRSKVSFCEMSSGAGHDAAVVATRRKSDGTPIPVGMIFIPCLNGKSHCPEEYATFEDLSRGTSVLIEALRSLAVS